MSDARNFSTLKKNMKLFELDNFCKKIAIQYANSSCDFSSSYFMKQNNLTKSCFYRILEYAVTRNLVSEETVDRMERKAILNQKKNSANAGRTSEQRYAELREKRNEYIISLYTAEDIRSLAHDFAGQSEVSKKEFAKKYEMNSKVLEQLLIKAFAEGYGDEEDCKEIERKSKLKFPGKRTEVFYAQLWQARNENGKS